MFLFERFALAYTQTFRAILGPWYIPILVSIQTTSQIRGVFGHHSNPGPILLNLHINNIIPAQKLPVIIF